MYQRVYDCGWNKADDLYVRDAVEDRDEAFNEDWLIFLKKLDIALDHSAWFVTRPLVAYPEPHSEPYPPILLPSFERDEYLINLRRGKTIGRWARPR